MHIYANSSKKHPPGRMLSAFSQFQPKACPSGLSIANRSKLKVPHRTIHAGPEQPVPKTRTQAPAPLFPLSKQPRLSCRIKAPFGDSSGLHALFCQCIYINRGSSNSQWSGKAVTISPRFRSASSIGFTSLCRSTVCQTDSTRFSQKSSINGRASGEIGRRPIIVARISSRRRMTTQGSS